MIVTTLANLSDYTSVHPLFAEAFRALAALAAEPFLRGQHPVLGDRIFINALEYDTKPAEDALMEAHRRYIDVMLLLEGSEEIAVFETDALTHVTVPYTPEADALLAQLEPQPLRVRMTPGSVCILFPEDAHAPGLDAEGTSRVRKLIAKIAVESR